MPQQTAQILTPPTPKTGLAGTDVDDDPPAQANMVELGYSDVQAPIVIDAVIMGEAATPRALTGAWWFGWHSKLNKAIALAPVNKGDDIEVSDAKGFAETLELVAGLYSYVGIGLGTLAGDTVALHVYPVEIQR